MEKTESEIIITNAFKQRTLHITDLVNNIKPLNSYEELKQYILTGEKTYDNVVAEFANLYSNLSQKLENANDKVSENLEYYRQNPHLAAQLIEQEFGITPYNNRMEILHPTSLKNDGILDVVSLKSIYDAYGYDGVKTYIELYRNPSSASSCLNDNSKQPIVMQYLLRKSGYKFSTPIKRDFSPKTLHELTENNIKDTLNVISSQKENFANFVNDKKNEISNWIADKQQEYNSIKEENDKNIQNLENTYETKLQLAAPVNFMKICCKEYAKSFRLWSLISVLLSLLIVAILVVAVTPAIENTEAIFTIKLFSKELPIYSNVAIIAIITLLAYLVKTTIKIALSAKHMEQEYRQKHILTEFLLTLSKDVTVDATTRNTIIMSLFDKADTGLVKYDTSENSLIGALSQIVKGAQK